MKNQKEVNMHKNFLNTLWEFTKRVEVDRESYIQKALNVYKAFKVKILKRHKLDVPPNNTVYSLFYKERKRKC